MNTFDLDEAQLLSIGYALHDTPVRSCRMEGNIALKQGGCGDKIVGDLVLTTAENYEVRVPFFLKKFSWKGKSEAVHYRHLARCAVPTPYLYGALLHADGDEILFLERLSRIGFDRQNESEWRQLFSLLARLNACKITPDYLPHLHPFEQGGRIDGWWITGFTPFPPAAEEIEVHLRACGAQASEISSLTLAAQQLCDCVAALPKGLVHQDFLADNLGWRDETAEMVVFDVHKNALGPRFADAAPYLGLPDWSNTAAYFNQKSSRRQALAEHYLQEYARYGGDNVRIERFYEEAALLFWAHKIAILWWLAEQQDTKRIEQVLNYLRS